MNKDIFLSLWTESGTLLIVRGMEKEKKKERNDRLGEFSSGGHQFFFLLI
jgi:hypothetical protein